MALKKCLDTYALVEIAKGNPNFAGYLSEDFVVTELTLMEFYYVLLREESRENAEKWLNKLEPYAVQIRLQILIESAKFRFQHRNRNISFFDAAGYVYSLVNSYLFVTGDKEFKDLRGVEFRK